MMDDDAFCTLARNAFDVMMRRGWKVYRRANGKWAVDIPIRDPFDGGTILHEENDPFTALVEADKFAAARGMPKRETEP